MSPLVGEGMWGFIHDMGAEPVRDLVRRPIRCILVSLFGHQGWADASFSGCYGRMSADDGLARSLKERPVRPVLELQNFGT